MVWCNVALAVVIVTTGHSLQDLFSFCGMTDLGLKSDRQAGHLVLRPGCRSSRGRGGCPTIVWWFF
jgi:hypothetical protein